MDLNVHIMRLTQIQEKIACGEEPTERERIYVRWLFSKVLEVGRRLIKELQSSLGVSSFKSLEYRLGEIGAERKQRVITDRDDG